VDQRDDEDFSEQEFEDEADDDEGEDVAKNTEKQSIVKKVKKEIKSRKPRDSSIIHKKVETERGKNYFEILVYRISI